ncbi:hypothetical protein [Spirobacillus cienkowskii]|jgi:hypothetical protein|uniref:Uncharacterized protein n=1 Tax=Spirobacillus cienkowskii TaxID=495820 RepID=A0A369KPK0_9BACT|nr:MAG: hypothetical protein DCC88_04395 [Spirobacillus cienkowskii]
MILNSNSVDLIRVNAVRLASAIRSKDDLVDLATASSFEQVFAAIETILTNTEMYFDDDLLIQLDVQNWQSFKAILLVYTLNVVNRQINLARESGFSHQGSRDFGASTNN